MHGFLCFVTAGFVSLNDKLSLNGGKHMIQKSSGEQKESQGAQFQDSSVEAGSCLERHFIASSLLEMN